MSSSPFPAGNMDISLLAVLVLLFQLLEGLKHFPKEDQNITVKWGDTAQLPCSFSPPKGVGKEGVQVSWQKEHSEMDLVVHFQNGKEDGDEQDGRFRGRTLVGRNWFQDGIAKLSLHRVTEEDSGKYTCWITLLPLRTSTQYKCCVVTLTVYEETTPKMVVKDDHGRMDQVMAWIFVLLIIGLLCTLPCLLTRRRTDNML